MASDATQVVRYGSSRSLASKLALTRNSEPERVGPHCIAGAVGQAGLVEVPHATRSPTALGSALAAGIMQCAAWAEVALEVDD